MAADVGAFAHAEAQRAHHGARKKREKEWRDADGDQPAPVEGGACNQHGRREHEPKPPAAENGAATPAPRFSRQLLSGALTSGVRHDCLSRLVEPDERLPLEPISNMSSGFSARLDSGIHIGRWSPPARFGPAVPPAAFRRRGTN